MNSKQQFNQARAQLAHLVEEAFISKYKRTRVFSGETYNLLGGYRNQSTADTVAEFVRETLHCFAQVTPVESGGWAESQLWVKRRWKGD